MNIQWLLQLRNNLVIFHFFNWIKESFYLRSEKQVLPNVLPVLTLIVLNEIYFDLYKKFAIPLVTIEIH